MKKIAVLLLSILVLLILASCSPTSYLKITSTSSNGAFVEAKDYGKVPSSLSIPSSIDGYKIIGISGLAFEKCEKLKRVKVPDGVTKICNGAFYGCYNLTWISLPSSLEQIGYGNTYEEYKDFGGCYKLSVIEFRGTREQWKKIKDTHYDEIKRASQLVGSGAQEITVRCTDGTITLW